MLGDNVWSGHVIYNSHESSRDLAEIAFKTRLERMNLNQRWNKGNICGDGGLERPFTSPHKDNLSFMNNLSAPRENLGDSGMRDWRWTVSETVLA